MTLDNLSGRIFDIQHIPVRDSHSVIGVTARRNIAKGEPILYTDLKVNE
jgi:N-acetylneuraminate synthase/sialic acid synthase